MEEKSLLKEKLIEEEKADVPVLEHKPINISTEAKQNEEELEKIAPVTEDSALKTKSVSKKWLTAILFIVVNLLAITLTAVIEFIGDEHPINISKVWGTFMQNWVWGLFAIILVIVAILAETLKRFLFLKNTLKKNMPLTSLSSAVLCKYYDNITPLGAGGQPFEIYYLRKKGLPIGIASGVPLVSYSLSKIAYVFVSFTAIFFHGFGEVGTLIQVLCIIGLIVNLLMPVAIISFALRPNFSSAIARFIAKIGKKLHLVKDEKAFFNKMTGSFMEYADCINYFIKKSKITILLGLVCSVVYYLALYSLPYFTIRMSGNHDVLWGEMFTYCVICYATVTLLPTPGGSGGAELSFRSIFANYLSGGILFWSMLSWRIFSYYSIILFGLIFIIGQQIAKFTKKIVVNEKKPHTKQPETPVEPEDELELYTPIPPTVPTAEDDIDTADQVSLAEATLEPESFDSEDIENVYDTVETVAEFTAVIESKSTLTITEERIEPVTHSNEPHQISISDLAEMDRSKNATDNHENADCEERDNVQEPPVERDNLRVDDLINQTDCAETRDKVQTEEQTANHSEENDSANKTNNASGDPQD